MTEWRIGRGWTNEELRERLDVVRTLDRNFDEPIEQMGLDHGWDEYFSEAIVGYEPEGPPMEDGPFERCSRAVAKYEFSDPRIVVGHFPAEDELLGRRMILELKALRMIRYLGSVVVSAVRDERGAERTVFGYRYDTLEGHIERGAEWFLLSKDHETGELRFRIEAVWRPGQFPNWWSRVGFSVLGPLYQRKWHARAHGYLAEIARDPSLPEATVGEEAIVTTPPEVIFKRFKAHHG